MGVRAPEFERLRKRRLRMLTVPLRDVRIPEVKAALTATERLARRYQKSMERPPKRNVLWRDLTGMNPFSNAISSQYLRLSGMAQAWATTGQKLHGNAALLRDIKWALGWLDANEFNAHVLEQGNWYDYEIDAPGCLTDTLMLLGDELSADQKEQYLRPVQKFDANVDVINVAPDRTLTSTGSNRTDKAMVELFTGILLNEEESIDRAVTAIKSVFRTVTEGDGFYADGSFVFHNFFPYTGNYGVVLLSDIADAFYLLKRTRWDFEEHERAMAVRWAMQSFTPLLYGGGMMDMVRGRLISFSSSPSHAVGHRTMAAMLRLSQSVSSKDATTIRARVKGWWARGTALPYTDGLTLDLVDEARRLRHSRTPRPSVPHAESKVFSSMDRAIHLRPNYGVGISMHSTRIQNYESINGNDLDGWHTSDGMVYLYDADLLQYDGNFWPTVDPERLPGTTVIHGSRPPEGKFGGSAAVGGTSLDCCSAVMMQLNVFEGRLQAKKSWFLFDNEIVALGADIRCTVPGKHVETIIANRRLTSSRTRKLIRSRSARWANLPRSTEVAPLGYVFTAHANVHARRARRTGSWHDIDSGLPREKLAATYQLLWIDHGVKPRHGSYEYVLLLGKDAKATAAYAARPTVRILQNNADAQAVEHRTPGITAINFWKAGATVAGITASAICSLMVRRTAGRVHIAVAEPTQLNSRPIHLTFDFAAGKTLSSDPRIKVLRRKPLTLAIHAGGAAGKTLHASFDGAGAPGL